MFEPVHKYLFLIALVIIGAAAEVRMQPPVPTPASDSVRKYLDPVGGMTADDAVRYAIENNPELAAMRKEAEAGEKLLIQAGLRANPSFSVSANRQVRGMDNSLMIEGGLPLELGGRRGARIRIAEAELEIRKLAVAERERQLAASVRTKFGEALAAALKLRFVEELLESAEDNYQIVAAQVAEGRRAPLERNMEVVELNRVRAERELFEGAAEIQLLELRNLLGMDPQAILRIRGDLDTLIATLPPQSDAVTAAIQRRTDLAGARAAERLAAARTNQARSEGRLDADLMVGYQRMRAGFPLQGYDSAGMLAPIENRMHFFTFGVRLQIPVTDRKQGMIAASLLEEEAAAKRTEFGELTVKRDVASAYVTYNRTVRAEEIYRVGVRRQAAENLGVVRQMYELGARTLLDYIAELRRYIQTESGFIDSQKDAYIARVEVLRAINSEELINR